MSNRKLFKTAGFVGIVTLISKFFGLIRDLVIARFYGTSIAADAYNFAYLLTGNALILLGGLGGPFHSATIATLTRVKDNAKESGSFLIKIFLSTFTALSVIAAIVFIFKSYIIHLLIPGNNLEAVYRDKLWNLTSMQLNIMLPLIIISGLLGILCGVSNVYGGFFWPSFSPILPSIAIVLLVFYFRDSEIGLALGIGTLIGAIFQLLVQLPDLIKAGLFENLKFAFVKNQKVVSDFCLFLGPALLSTTIGQITVYIDGFFCSNLEEGSWTATVLANRLIQLPLGVLLTSFLVPFFPKFSELSHSGNISELKKTSIMVIRSLWFLTLPIAVFLFLFSKPIIQVVFERGAFDERSTMLTNSILVALILSMIAYVARDTLTRVFYSLGDSRLPLIVAIFSIVLKIILNTVLVRKYHASGIAFATSLVTVFNFLFLWFLLRNKIGRLGWAMHIRSLMKLIVVSFVMYLFGVLFLSVFPVHIKDYDFISKLILIFTSFSVCFLVYFGLALTIRLEEAENIVREINKKLFKTN